MTHVITGLDTGGAETMLYRLLSHTDREAFEPRVVSMTGVGPVGEEIRGLGVPVESLGMRRGVPDPRGVLRLARYLRRDAPDVVQTWMYQADLVGGLATKLSVRPTPVAWGIHSTHLDPRKVKASKILTVRACALSSHLLPARIVCCSEASRVVHARMGYRTNGMLVIPNGVDLASFKHDPDARASVREELGVEAETRLVGLVARFDPQKDHETFIRAAALLRNRLPDVDFVLCGTGITWENRELVRWIDSAGVRARCHLLGRRSDTPRLTAALDVASSSSAYGEAWPLVVGEAMACAVPCAVTDVGDSALIVGDTGRVVPPKDPASLAAAWQDLLTLRPEQRTALGLAARRRVEERFGLPEAVKRYEALYEELSLAGNRTARLGWSSGRWFGVGQG